MCESPFTLLPLLNPLLHNLCERIDSSKAEILEPRFLDTYSKTLYALNLKNLLHGRAFIFLLV